MSPPWTVTLFYKLADADVRCPAYDGLYPVNSLRNAALAAARSDLVFLLDVDFVPSSGLHARLLGGRQCDLLPKALSGGNGRAPVALVVPAFEVRESVTHAWDQEALREACDASTAKGFHVDHFPQGHRATNFIRWHRQSRIEDGGDLHLVEIEHGLQAYRVDYEEHFEPYIVVSRSRVPMYDERFRGYGLNKISHLYEVNMRGFDFCVIDHLDAFVIAEEHPKSQSWELMYGPGAPLEARARIATHYEIFKEELRVSLALSRPLPVTPVAMRAASADLIPSAVAEAQDTASKQMRASNLGAVSNDSGDEGRTAEKPADSETASTTASGDEGFSDEAGASDGGDARHRAACEKCSGEKCSTGSRVKASADPWMASGILRCPS
jgi:glycosyltransferase-like protein LARGE